MHGRFPSDTRQMRKNPTKSLALQIDIDKNGWNDSLIWKSNNKCKGVEYK